MVADRLEPTGRVKLTEVKEATPPIGLLIETASIPDGYNLKDEYSIVVESFEIASSETQLKSDLVFDINNIDGRCFQVPGESGSVVSLRYVSLLTERGPDGEIRIPDEPYSTGSFRLEPGFYRVFVEQC
jgi:hypothetical protein